MALANINLKSASLGKSTRVRIIIPDHACPPYPVCYLLHGLSDDESQWTRATRLEEYAERHPFLIVMPDGGRSFYCDSPLGNYETFLRQELPERIETWFPTVDVARGRVIGGLSMGGYGALKMALKYPDFYGAAFSHSGAVMFGHVLEDLDKQANRPPDVKLLVQSIRRDDNDLFSLVDRLAPEEMPALYLDCGAEDFLLAGNVKFHEHLALRRIDHEYAVFPGAHTWVYWDENIQKSLRFAASRYRLGERARDGGA